MHFFFILLLKLSISAAIYQVEQGKNLELECKFYMDEGSDHQPLTIKWFWQDRPITNNSEGVVQPQQFRILEYDSLLGNKTQRKVKLLSSLSRYRIRLMDFLSLFLISFSFLA